MKKFLKLFYTVVLTISLLFSLQTVALASDVQETFLDDGGGSGGSSSGSGSSGSSWVNSMLQEAEGWGTENNAVTTTTKNVVGTIMTVIRIVGMGVAIIMITYVAIKYMSAAPSEKAEFKKSATALIVGAVVLFASSNILAIIADFATKNIHT